MWVILYTVCSRFVALTVNTLIEVGNSDRSIPLLETLTVKSVKVCRKVRKVNYRQLYCCEECHRDFSPVQIRPDQD